MFASFPSRYPLRGHCGLCIYPLSIPLQSIQARKRLSQETQYLELMSLEQDRLHHVLYKIHC